MVAAASGPTKLHRQAYYARLAEERPHDSDAHMFHGNAQLEAGDIHAAIAAYTTALGLRPQHAPTLYNLGNAQLALGDAASAERSYAAALALDPEHAGSHNNCGNALRRLRRDREAIDSYRAALSLRPELVGTRTNLAAALLGTHEPELALAELHQVLRQAPDYAEAYNNMGGALLALDRQAEAQTWFRRAIALDPALVQARFGESMALLTQGRLLEGFRAYEARWLDPRYREDVRSYDRALWRGSDEVAGRTILVHHEQGLGDTIQFARYVPLLRARGARMILEVQPTLAELLSPLADAVVEAGAELPPHDWHVPVMSMAHAFGTNTGTIPAAVPYVRAAACLPGVRGPGLNVAVTLRGSPDHPEDALRSIPQSLARPLLEIAGVTFHIVDRSNGARADPDFADLASVRVHGPGLRNFADTAALLAAMDLVITVDTALAHLAGAMGLPLWVLLQHAADFRWLRGRNDNPWYPTARLFRQAADRAWHPVIQAAAEGVKALAAT